MRFLTGLTALALVALSAPVFAQETETPATETPATETPATEAPVTETPATEAPADGAGDVVETPAVAPTPVPEGVSAEIDKILWCGHAFSRVAADITAAGDAETGANMAVSADALIAQGAQSLTDAGFTSEQLEATKAVYVAQITVELEGDGSNAKFAYEDCLPLTAAISTPAPAEATPDAAPAP